MKRFLFVILVAVAAVLLWAIRAEAYSNGLVFSLGLVVTALSGYLIADYFFRLDRKSLSNNLHISQKENQALKERIDLLQTQLTTATPHSEVEQFEQRMAILEDEKSKLDGISRAQTAEIAGLKERIDALQKSNTKLLEESAILTETSGTQTTALQGELAANKAKINELMDENAALRDHNNALVDELDAVNSQISTHTERGISDVSVDEKGNASSDTLDNQEVVVGRDLNLITELESDDEADEVEDTFGTSDNLQAIEGIGPKFESVLKQANIANWETLSMTTPERLRVVLDNSGSQYHSIYPLSWPEQARLLVHREFAKLKKYKE